MQDKNISLYDIQLAPPGTVVRGIILYVDIVMVRLTGDKGQHGLAVSG